MLSVLGGGLTGGFSEELGRAVASAPEWHRVVLTHKSPEELTVTWCSLVDRALPRLYFRRSSTPLQIFKTVPLPAGLLGLTEACLESKWSRWDSNSGVAPGSRPFLPLNAGLGRSVRGRIRAWPSGPRRLPRTAATIHSIFWKTSVFSFKSVFRKCIFKYACGNYIVDLKRGFPGEPVFTDHVLLVPTATDHLAYLAFNTDSG